MPDLRKDIKYLPVFIVLVCVYFHNVFLKGTLLVIDDGFEYYYPMMITMIKQYESFIFPFWNPLQYSGFPLLASLEASALYPLNIAFPLFLEPFWAYNLNLMLHYSLAGFFTFLYARQIGLSVFAALISGTVFSLLGYLPAHLHHQSVINSAIWLPLILYFYERLRQEHHIKYACYAAIAIALQVFAGHPQICFYTYVVLFLYVFFHFMNAKDPQRLKFALSGIFSLVLGWLIALPQIAASYELTTMAMRKEITYEFFSSYAFPIHKITTFLFPFFYYSEGKYWGPVPELGHEAFIGTLPFLLAVLVMMRWKKNPHILFWGIIAAFALLLSFGDGIPLLNRLTYQIPGFNSFRGPSKHLLEVSFALSILAGFGISFLQNQEKEKNFHAVVTAVFFTVIVSSAIVFTFFQTDIRGFFQKTFSHMQHLQLRWTLPGVPENALGMTDPSIYVPIIIMSSYLLCLLALMKARGKIIRTLLLSAMFTIIFIEAFSWKMTGLPRKEDIENYNKGLYSILSSTGDGRTIFFFRNIPPLTAMPWGIRLIEGYESLEIGDYRKFIPRMYAQPSEVWLKFLKSNSVLSMLNARHLIISTELRGIDEIKWQTVRDRDGRMSPFVPEYVSHEGADYVPIYRKIANFTSFTLYENVLALPRAYPIASLKALNSAEEISQGLFSFELLPWYEAAVSEKDLREIGSRSFSQGTVNITKDLAHEVTLTTEFEEKGFVVLADQFYPGWKVYIDGSRSKIYKTNGILRGVVVPGGNHVVEFKYVPLHLYASMAVSAALFIIMLVVLVKKRH